MEKIKTKILLPFLAVFVLFFGFLLTSSTVAVEKVDAYYFNDSLPAQNRFTNAFRSNAQFNDNEQDLTDYNLFYDMQSGAFSTRYITSPTSQDIEFTLGWIENTYTYRSSLSGSYRKGLSIVMDTYNFEDAYPLSIYVLESYYLNGAPVLNRYQILDFEESERDYIPNFSIVEGREYYVYMDIPEGFMWDNTDTQFRIGIYTVDQYYPVYTQNPNEFLEIYGDSGGDYTQGFEDGFAKGSSISTNNAYEQGLNKGYADGQLAGYDKGYSKGVEDADKGFVNAVSTVLFAPVQITKDFLNFDLLGYNMLSFFTGIITLLIIVKVVRIFI